MDLKLESYLAKKYPLLYRVTYHGKRYNVPFECGDGWFCMLDELSQKLTDLEVCDCIHIGQVKEKFGTLSYYYSISPLPINSNLQFLSDNIEDIVREYCNKSATICEWCGKEGKRRSSGWIRVLCDRCTNLNGREIRPWLKEWPLPPIKPPE